MITTKPDVNGMVKPIYVPSKKPDFLCPLCLDNIFMGDMLLYCNRCNTAYSSSEAKNRLTKIRDQYFCCNNNISHRHICPKCTAVARQNSIRVIVYTGMLYEEICDNPMTALCDLIIDGEFRADLNDGLSLRGSSNQRVMMCTDRYLDQRYLYGAKGREVEYHPQSDGFNIVGIPGKF